MRNMIFLLLIMAAGCTQTIRIEEKKIAGDVYEYVLNNGELACGVIPAASGLLASFEYLPGGKLLFEPVNFSVETDDLLPTVIKSGATGARELLWGTRRFHNLPMQILAITQSEKSARMSMKQNFFPPRLFPLKRWSN